MKVLVGSFQCESNTFCADIAQITDFEMFFGTDCTDKLAASEIFMQEGIEIVPSVFASALPTGMVSEAAYSQIEGLFCDIVRNNTDLSGIYLYLHGSMYVEGKGSGEAALLNALRRCVGQEMPISVALDFHANLSDDFIRNVQAIEGFRTAPHTDQKETEHRAASALIKLIRTKRKPSVEYFRIPFLCADAAVTSKKPFKDVYQIISRIEKNDDTVSAAFFNGQVWYDSDYTGNLAVVSSFADNAFHNACNIARAFWEGREYLLIDNAMDTDKAVKASLNCDESLVFVTDSGDNTTAGAGGKGTLLLNKYLKAAERKVLVCGIYDDMNTNALMDSPIGKEHEITLCKGHHEAQLQETTINVCYMGKGKVIGWAGEETGDGVILRAGNVDIVLTNVRAAFTTRAHFEKMGIDVASYRVIVLKMGYLFPELLEISQKSIFALTPGESSNDFASMDYRKLNRRIYPIAKDITWEEILKTAKAGREEDGHGTCGYIF